MKIAIVGTGYVGLVSGACFAEVGIDVTCVDVDATKINNLTSGKIPIYEPGLDDLVKRNTAAGRLHFTTDLAECIDQVEVVFCAVGTPPDEDGSADLKYVRSVARQFGRLINRYTIFVTKSTVPVGTSRIVSDEISAELKARGSEIDFEVASNPEFLKEGAAIKDFMSPDRVVIGTDSQRARKVMERLYRPFLLNNFRVIFMDIASAEMTKYAANSMLATRISFMNDIANLCELVGADVNMVRKGIGSDARIGTKFLYPGCGYGGSCFPKDTKALKYLARQNGYTLRTVEAAVDVNAEQKTKLFHKASNRMITFQNLKVAVLGLAFKAGTDDLREAPSLDNVQLLLESGADLYAYDPVAADNFKKRYPEGANEKGTIQYVSTPEEALEGANICFIFTEWGEIRAVTPETFKEKMRIPLVYDGRNLYSLDAMREAGVEYYSIGR